MYGKKAMIAITINAATTYKSFAFLSFMSKYIASNTIKHISMSKAIALKRTVVE